ncbi:hypothetical protein [Brachybacterium kimchii]|uniref:Uncharacterized protein n=1 Tax=Brachybacterium kimchii TaxID=2942909 RepID=A0ABY4N7P5_9MICO|nr:hypothetical protein [Brachybacterium kimchii]UQN30576.1 hypothetical protein M4486_04485 [Brachybacterium kimchii]
MNDDMTHAEGKAPGSEDENGGRAQLRKQVAVDMLMVTQGDVDPIYAWQVQDEEVRQELLEQADAAIARIVSELDLAARLLPAHAPFANSRGAGA